MNKYSKEIIYVATGEKYRLEVITSAISVRHCSPEISLSLFTDEPSAFSSYLFNNIHFTPHTNRVFAQKIHCMQKATANRCLFLDTDTLICTPIDSIFDILDRFDIAASHASWRFSPGLKNGNKVMNFYGNKNIPSSFVDFNTGVVLFKRTTPVLRFFQGWLCEYDNQLTDTECYPANDQAAFRAALWNSDLNIYVLPPEYNYRADFPGFVADNIRIFHGRHARLHDMPAIINQRSGARVFDPDSWKLICSQYCTNAE